MLFQKILKKRRAVSPVIAAILLIGLTVAAGAIVYFLVFSQTDKAEASFSVSATTTKITVTVSNSGSKSDKIGQINIEPGAGSTITQTSTGGNIECDTTGDNDDSWDATDGYQWNDLDYAISASETGEPIEFIPISGEFGDPGDEITVTIIFDETGSITKTGAI